MPTKKQTLLILYLVLYSILGTIGLRFLLVENVITHYHANFAVYVDGKKDPFERFTFYEEVAACSPDNAVAPESRVHLHNNEPHVVHVHDEAATWSHFFSNLGYGLTDDLLQTDDGTYSSNLNDGQLRFVLNGRVVDGISNMTIGDEDVLLVDYSSDSDATLLVRYASIPRDAQVYNSANDPATCSGGAHESFTDRLKRTIGIG